MSDAEKRPFQQMMTIATAVAEWLRPACHRIEIAGSLRRKRAMIGDVEICALAIMHTNLLGEPSERSHVDDKLARPHIRLLKNGPRMKVFEFEGTSGATYKIDLFLPLPECWPVVYMMRTGSWEFSKRMVTAKSMGGYRPEHLTVKDGRVWEAGRALEVESERHLFEIWQMEYLPPEQR